ncbi:MAG TPA: ArsA-related P-loop ATPase [Acidimicrobiales bacterium]|jgi:anion-transporting  ArsA/GET3 family ATPase|nr:ArsA-related P-loop ATPase [Acidimicrobiales bacterium]
MDPAGFCTQSRVLIVAGKGGVGKTTVTAALARMAALAGLTTLIVEVEGKSGIGAAFGHPDPLTYEEVVLSPGGGPDGAADVRARTLTPDDALLEYLEDHGMRRISRRLLSSGAIDVVSTAVPGIKDILVLGKVKQLERSASADLIVLDAPAAGHAVTFLTSASGLMDAIRVGPIRTQAEEVLALLSDPARCQVLLVTLPEETPVNEVVETAFKLEDRVGVSLAPVVVNGLYPPIDGLDVDPEEAAGAAEVFLRPGEASALRSAADFRRERMALQASQVSRLAAALPLAQLELPFLFTTELGPAEVDTLARALADSVRKLP